jgi:hypothetical protein
MISTKQFASSNTNHQIDRLRKRLDAWRKSHRPTPESAAGYGMPQFKLPGNTGLTKRLKLYTLIITISKNALMPATSGEDRLHLL